MSKYNFYYDDKNGVICVSSYAGRKVRAIAKCHPNDKFDYEYGCALAQARVDAKIAEKRAARAVRKVAEARKAFEKARQYCYDMGVYQADANLALEAAYKRVEYLENTL